MGMYTMSLMGLIDTYILNEQDTLKNVTTKYRIDKGKSILLTGVKLQNTDVAEDFIDKFIRGFIIQNLTENIIYDSAERWLLRFQLEVEIKLPLYINKYEALQKIKIDNIEQLGKVTATADNDSKAISSAYPQHINSAKNIDDVKYMDAGSMSNAESKSTSVSYGNILDRIEQLDKAQKNYIQEAIDDFSNLFMSVY